MDILEKDLEQKLVREVKRIGGWALKFTSPGQAGVPDRILLFPGKVYFVEPKAPGHTLRPLQEQVIRRMRNLQQKVFTVSSADELEWLIQFIKDDRYRVTQEVL